MLELMSVGGLVLVLVGGLMSVGGLVLVLVGGLMSVGWC